MNTRIRGSNSRFAAVALGTTLLASTSMPLYAAELWKVDSARSHFGMGSNTLVLERVTGNPTHPSTDATSAAGTFLVISGGNVYLAEQEAADAAPRNGVRTVDYTRWRDMKIMQIGANVRSADTCGFRCQAGLTDNRMTLRFTANGVDASKYMGNVFAFSD